MSMQSEVVTFTISNSSRALILLGSFSKCRIVIVQFMTRQRPTQTTADDANRIFLVLKLVQCVYVTLQIAHIYIGD